MSFGSPGNDVEWVEGMRGKLINRQKQATSYTMAVDLNDMAVQAVKDPRWPRVMVRYVERPGIHDGSTPSTKSFFARRSPPWPS